MAAPTDKKYFNQENTNRVFEKKLRAQGEERKEIMSKVVFDFFGSA